MDPTLRLQPGQEALTPAQEAEARRFADECIRTQLSTEPVDEPEAEALLRQAYAVAGLEPPKQIIWLNGPLQFGAVLGPESVWDHMWDSVEGRLRASVEDRVRESVDTSVDTSVRVSVWHRVLDRVRNSVGANARASVRASVRDRVWESVTASVRDRVQASVTARVWDSVRASVRAYEDAYWLAPSQFFDEYLVPNDLHALARFNERVSGYWLGKEVALVVRRPRLLCRDAEGRLHSATGKCLEYHDGWGFYAWHGVVVPERVILAPERLSRDDFLNEQDVEVRRVMQERMGNRFVPELGGVVLDSCPRGTLYEVKLPTDDPERVARYAQVQDASTERRYFLRVPPTVQTAAEAVAWTFQVSVEDYHPTQET
jgi:hypothetical protein